MKSAGAQILAFTALVAISACSSGDTADDAASSPEVPATVEAPTVTAAPATEPTAADFTSYELTMDKMRQWAAVTKSLSTLSGTSADTAAMRTVRIGTDPISESEKKIEAIAPMRLIFENAGLTPREYHLITGAYGMSQLPTSRNAEFVKTNKAELDRLMATLR